MEKILLAGLLFLSIGCTKNQCVQEFEKPQIISEKYYLEYNGANFYIYKNFTKEIVFIQINKKFTNSNKIYVQEVIEKLDGVRKVDIISDNEVELHIDFMKWLKQKDEILDWIIRCDHKCFCYSCMCKYNEMCVCNSCCECKPDCPSRNKK